MLEASNAGFASTSAEDDVHARLLNRLRAAVHLFALTGDDAFRVWFDGHVGESALVRNGHASLYDVGFVEAVLTYTTLPGASPGLSRELRRIVLASLRAQLSEARDADPYGAWMRVREIAWGSNRTLCHQARLFALACRFSLLRLDERPEAERLASGAIHVVHGMNALGLCMLTAMQPYGAPSSVRETYHGWFADGTPFDRAGSSEFGPPPGFLVGGPNPTWKPDASYDGPPLVPPTGQPPLKSYRDWNAGWPENSWELSECQLAYQASYVALLAHVIARG